MYSCCKNYVKFLEFDEFLFIFMPSHMLHLLLRVLLFGFTQEISWSLFQIFLKSIPQLSPGQLEELHFPAVMATHVSFSLRIQLVARGGGCQFVCLLYTTETYLRAKFFFF